MADTNEQIFIKIIQGECNPEEEQQFLTWLSESEDNANIYFQYKMLWQARKVNIYSGEIFLNNSLEKYNKRIDILQLEERRKNIFKIVRYAALFIALISIPALFWYIKSHKSVEKLITETVACRGIIKVISLADGTKVWLNNGSTIIYPLKFENSERTVLLDGEAFLEVKKDPEHPFIVKTQSIQVKVLGTSFNVNTKCEGNVVQTTLVEGSVILMDEKGGILASLKPGQMAAIDNKSKKVNIKDINTKNYVAWQTGLVSLEKASLSEIIAKIEVVYNIRIKLDEKLVTKNQIQKRYNFVFRRSQPVDTVFEMLKFLAPVEYVKNRKNHNPKN